MIEENVNRFIDRYESLMFHYRENPHEGIVEVHHIIPKCMGGSDHYMNLVSLPPKAHFIAHYLLHKAYPDNDKLAHAFAMMGVNNKHQSRKQTGRLYEQSKIARSKVLKGKPRPEWVKAKMRKPKKSNKNYFGNTNGRGNRGKSITRTTEHQEAITQSLRPYWEEKKEATRMRNEGWRRKFSTSQLTQRQFADLHKIPRSVLYGVKKLKSGD